MTRHDRDALLTIRSVRTLIGMMVAFLASVVAIEVLLADPGWKLITVLIGASALAAVVLLGLGRSLRLSVIAVSDRARSHVRLADELMQSVDAFADGAAGVAGTTIALARTARTTGCDIYRWDATTRIVTDVRTGTEHMVAPAMAMQLDRLLARHVPVRIPDVMVDAALPAAISTAGGTRALLLAPMASGSQQHGFVLRRYGSAQAMYEVDERDRVGAVASIGSVALSKAVVVDSEQQRARDNAMLFRSIEHASTSDLTEVICAFASETAQLVAADRCVVFGVHGRHLNVHGWHGMSRTDATATRAVTVTSSALEVFRGLGSRPVRIDIAEIDSKLAATCTMLGLSIEGAIVQPIVDGAGLITGLIVLAGAARTLGDRECDLLAVLGRQIASMLERNELSAHIETSSRRLARTPLLARNIADQREPRAIARIAAGELHEGFGFCRVTIALDGDNGLEVTASAGRLPRLALQDGIPGSFIEAFEHGRTFVQCGATGAGDVPDANAPVGCRSQLAVPIPGPEGTPVGVIGVYQRNPDSLNEDDLHLIQSVADHLSGSLQQAKLYVELEKSYFKTVEALSTALEAKDAYTLDHSRSITEIAAAVGRRLGMGDDEVRTLRLGALLHDIGKIGIPTEILNKPGPLTDRERVVMEQHTLIGEQIIAPVEFLDDVRPLVLHEHERWDGKGYPHNLQGEDIPLGARIIFVCDAYHAMTTDRPYRRALPRDEARRRLTDGSDSQFDPNVVRAFLALTRDEVAQIESFDGPTPVM